MENLVDKIRNFGVTEELESSLKRKVQTSNLIYPIAGFFVFVILIALILIGARIETILNSIIITFLVFSCSILNFFGKISFSRNLFFLINVLGVCSSAFFIGENFNAGVILVPSVGLPFILFTRNERTTIFAWIVLVIISYFLLLYLYEVVEPLDPMPVADAIYINNIVNVLLFGWVASLFVLVTNEGDEREVKLKEVLDLEIDLKSTLESNLKQIVNDQETIITKEREKIIAQENEELALKKADFKTSFLAKMSHELRTPLNGIIGNIELWRRKSNLVGEDKQYLQRISTSSQLLLGIVNDVLDLSKIEEGKMELHPSTISFNKIIGNSIQLYRSLGDVKGLEIVSQISDDIPQFLNLDSLRLSQIVNNLLSNAVKFSDQGKIEIKVSLVDQDFIKIQVIDQGVGLTEESSETLFDDYTQVASELQFKGSGLGLSICKSLAHLMGGEIGVVSEPGKGSSFWFTFLYKNVTAEEVSEGLIQVSETQLNLNVLLVDDMEINLSLAKAMLEEYGCIVTTANCGVNAIESYEVGKYDLVLMDINMPDVNGDIVVQKLRELHEVDSVFIGLSANAMEGEKERYLKRGLDDYMSKPITFEKLLTCLQSWFSVNESQARTIQVGDDNHCFLIDEDKVKEHIKLMGGWTIFSKFVDKFIDQNESIFKEIKLAFNGEEIAQLSLDLHKLSGIASSMGATGYYEILHEAYSSLARGAEFSDEEFGVLEMASKEVNEKFKEIKTEWEE